MPADTNRIASTNSAPPKHQSAPPKHPPSTPQAPISMATDMLTGNLVSHVCMGPARSKKMREKWYKTMSKLPYIDRITSGAQVGRKLENTLSTGWAYLFRCSRRRESAIPSEHYQHGHYVEHGMWRVCVAWNGAARIESTTHAHSAAAVGDCRNAYRGGGEGTGGCR